jgi:hypothetical protein
MAKPEKENCVPIPYWESTKELVSHIDNNDKYIWASFEALAKNGQYDGIKALIKYAFSMDGYIRKKALLAIRKHKMRNEAKEVLLNAYNDENEYILNDALHDVETILDFNLYSIVLNHCYSNNEIIAASAIKAFEVFNRPGDYEKIRAIFKNDIRTNVHYQAIYYLINCVTEEKVEDVLDILINENTKEFKILICELMEKYPIIDHAYLVVLENDKDGHVRKRAMKTKNRIA